MAFSLSPSVQTREFDLAQNVPNLPSSKTGMVLRADTGPLFKIVSVTNEADLEKAFGKPTADNYQDWFQAWNFLQYAGSLYIVRAGKADKSTKNAGIGLTGSTFDSSASASNFSNFYNKDVAENALAASVGFTAQRLYFINKNVTSVQDLSVAVCSSKKYYKSQVGLEYYANVAPSGANAGTITVNATGTTTLTKGSKVILNGSKLAEVVSVTQSTDATIVFDRAVSASDVAPFYAVGAAVSSGLVASFKTAGFTFKRGTKISQGASADFYVDSINTSTDGLTYSVTFVKIGTGGAAGPTVSTDVVLTGTDKYFVGSTAFNALRGDYGIAAGATEVALNPGFILEEGATVTIGTATGLRIAAVDEVGNKIILSAPVTAAVVSVGSATVTTTSSTIETPVLIGINNFNLVYDDSVIVKTRQTVFDKTGTSVTVVAEKLISFDRLVEFEPIWAKEEFLVVILKKNSDGKYEVYGKPQLVSYKEGGRDSNGRNNFVESVFFESATLPVYAKVGGGIGNVDTGATLIRKIVGDSATTSTTVYPKLATGAGLYSAVYDGTGYAVGDIQEAQDLFGDPESFDINLLITHEKDMNGMGTIASTRKDCVAIIAPYDYGFLSTSANSDATTFLLERFGTQTQFANKSFSAFSTYASIYGNMKYQYDKYNDVNRWICVAGDIAGLAAQTDANRDPWWAVAGNQRGVIKNAIKLAFNPNKQNRDDLYVNAINPIISIPGEGNAVVMGQKTATSTASAFDRLNVRRLLIFCEKAIATAARTGLFEFNDAFTRQRLFSMIEPFLRTVKARRGLYDYKLVIDATNNTSEVIDANGLLIDVYLKPAKVAEFIQVNAVVVKTGVSFTEVVGKF